MSGIRLRVLDDLRGIAILLVVAMHLADGIFGVERPAGSPIVGTFVYAGGTGVTLFFILSGILVSRPFLRAASRGEPVDGWDYLVQRVLRIVPMFYLVGLFGIAVTGKFDQALNVLTFRAAGTDVAEYSMVWWSLTTEVQFYLVLPLAFMIWRMPGGRWLLPTLLAAWAVFLGLFVLGYAPSMSLQMALDLELSLFGRAPAFAAGVAIAYLYDRNRLPQLNAGVALPLLAVGVFALHQVLDHLLDHWGRLFVMTYPAAIFVETAAWSWIVLVVLAWGRCLMGIPGTALRYLGRISFSLYLVHQPVLHLWLRQRESLAPLDNWSAFLLVFFCSILVSQATYSLVERPMLRLKDRLRPTPSAPEIAT